MAWNDHTGRLDPVVLSHVLGAFGWEGMLVWFNSGNVVPIGTLDDGYEGPCSAIILGWRLELDGAIAASGGMVSGAAPGETSVPIPAPVGHTARLVIVHAC